MRVISIIVCLRVGGDPALHKGTPHTSLSRYHSLAPAFKTKRKTGAVNF